MKIENSQGSGQAQGPTGARVFIEARKVPIPESFSLSDTPHIVTKMNPDPVMLRFAAPYMQRVETGHPFSATRVQ
jgi:hypothetical protein